jgi:hypothetical protein
MSRSKKVRAKARRRPAAPPARPQPDPERNDEQSRLAPVRRRMRVARLGIGATAVVGLGAGMAMARVTYAGHSKHPVKELAIPQPLYNVVRQNLLQAGIVAPATAPPDASTSTS